MTFMTLMGGVFVFGALWLVLPRTSFVVALGIALHLGGCKIFTTDASAWAAIAVILLFLGVIAGLFADLALMRHLYENSDM